MHGKPQKEHDWLKQLVGEWTYETDCSMGPGKPRETFKGSQSARMIGGLWLVGEGLCEMPGGGTGTMLLTIGYDPQKGRYAGTWVGSMMPMLWVYDGAMDETGKVLTLESDGPSFAGDGTMAKYRDIVAITGDGAYQFSSHVLGPDGTWTEFMTAQYRRTA
jgi:hypothetical protein